MNRYGIGPGVVSLPRCYTVEARCKVRVNFHGCRSPEDAELQFYDYAEDVGGQFPEIIFEEILDLVASDF